MREFELPLSVWVGLATWGLLLMIQIFTPSLSSEASVVLAGVVMAWSFALLGWYANKVGMIPHRAQIRKIATQHSSTSHVVYAALVFFLASILGRGQVFGIMFASSGVMLVIIATGVGAAFGFVMSLGMEVDNGMTDLGQIEGGGWSFGFASAMTFSIWIVVFGIIASAGGALFALTVMATRAGLSLMIYRLYPTMFNKPGWETLGDHFLALSLMIIPPVAYLSA